MDEFEACPLRVRAGSLHLRHEVHEHHRVDAHHQQRHDEHDDGHHGHHAAERLQCGIRGMGGWSVRHGTGIPYFVRIHPRPGAL